MTLRNLLKCSVNILSMKLILFTSRSSIIEPTFPGKISLVKFCILINLHHTLVKLQNHTAVSWRFNSNRTWENPFLHSLNKHRGNSIYTWTNLSSFTSKIFIYRAHWLWSFCRPVQTSFPHFKFSSTSLHPPYFPFLSYFSSRACFTGQPVSR
jgi:hypothetical protein